MVTVLAAIVAPAFFWIGYYYYKDRVKHEPVAKIVQTFCLGFIAGFLCWGFYQIQPSFGFPSNLMALMSQRTKIDLLIYYIGGVGLVEEFFKFLPFLIVIRHFKAFDEKIDGIVYASALAVGFASFENLGYLPTMKGWLLIGRAFASPLTHVIFASIWGYVVGKASLLKKPLLPAALRGIFLAAVIHGLFNVLTFDPTLRFLSALLILAVWIWQIRTLEKETKKQEKSLKSQRENV